MIESLDRKVGATAFGADVAGYAAGRLDYPDRLFEMLADRCGLQTGARVLEIGPGTGQATRRLLDMGAHVVAVEPDVELAAHLRGLGARRLDVDPRPFGEQIAGHGSFDLIVAATAFHWLDSSVALSHVRRLLKRNGVFAMWWNVFHEPGTDKLFDALFEGLARPPSMLTGQHYSLDVEGRRNELIAAGFVNVEHIMLSSPVATTPAALRMLFSTFSAVRSMPAAEREERLDAVQRKALLEYGERFERVVRTPLYFGHAH